MKRAAKLALVMSVAAAGAAFLPRRILAVSLSATGTYSQNFNSMGVATNGPAASALPAGWVVSPKDGGGTPTYAAGGSTTSQAASSGSPTAGGIYNWGMSTDTSDRALGFETSDNYSSPNSVMLKLDNTTGSTVTEFDFSYDIERYRVANAAAQVNLFVSTDGVNWIADTAGDTGPFSTGSSTFTFSASQTVVSKPVAVTGLSIATGSSYYIRWNFDTTGVNSQGLGLDNFVLTSVLIPGSGPANLTWSPSSPTSTAWNNTPTNKNWTNATAVAAPFNSGDSVNFTDAGLPNGSIVVISNSGVSAGTVSFAQSGIYTVSGGALIASGALTVTGGGTVVMNTTVSATSVGVSKGTLAGTGTFTTSVMVGGTAAGLMPGSNGSAGTMTMTSLALQGSTLFMDLGPSNASDFISINGGLTLTGSNLITLNNIFGYAVGTYTLMHYTGTAPATLANLGLTSANVGGKYAYLSNNAANSSIDVIIQDVATSAPHSFTGNAGASPAWLAAANWNDGVVPATTDIAIFSAAAPTLGIIGIDLGAATNNSVGNQAVGAVRLTAAPDRTINNSSSANDGTLTLNGVKGELLTNFAAASTLTLANGSSRAMSITLGSFGAVEVTNAAAAIIISSNVGGPGGINKTGFGTFVLSGTNTYTGGTTVSAGTLLINSPASGLGTGPAMVLSGATLGGTGAAGTPITIATDGIVNPGVPGAVGTLTVGALTIGALSQNTAQFNFDVSATSVDKLISGPLTLIGSINVKLTKIGVGIPTNTFTLLDYTGTPLPNLAHFTLDASALPPAFIYTLVNNTANTSIDLAITPAANALTWDGTVNGTWDTAGPANWKGSATTYSNNKSLTFDDTASGTTSISITSAVAPAGVTFNNGALTYILTSTSGNIGGSTSLTMAGTGTTILSGTNTYTGGTTINSGTLLLAGPAMLPVAASGPSVIINPGGTLAFAPAAVTHAGSLSATSTFFGLNGGKISLSNNDLFISGGAAGAIAMNRALVAATSNGVALLTTGVMTGADWRALHPASTPFDTITNINPGDLLLRFGYAGDANFDGRITIDDYLLIDQGYLTGATDYTHGNFDHSPGPVDAADYALIDANYLNLSGTLAAGEIALHTAEFGAAYTDAFNALINPALSAQVPEPATLPLLTLSAVALLRRAKRAKRGSGVRRVF